MTTFTAARRCNSRRMHFCIVVTGIWEIKRIAFSISSTVVGLMLERMKKNSIHRSIYYGCPKQSRKSFRIDGCIRENFRIHFFLAQANNWEIMHGINWTDGDIHTRHTDEHETQDIRMFECFIVIVWATHGLFG